MAARSLLVLGLVLGGCHHGASLTPAQLAHFHRVCVAGIADGSFQLRPSARVGIGAQEPPGTPVVIYGASWCVACDDAVKYLQLRGIPFVERDVEEDPAALAERDRLVAAVGLAPTTALPVVDVRGTVTIGFMPCVVDALWPGA